MYNIYTFTTTCPTCSQTNKPKTENVLQNSRNVKQSRGLTVILFCISIKKIAIRCTFLKFFPDFFLFLHSTTCDYKNVVDGGQ